MSMENPTKSRMLKIRLLSSLAKVFADEELKDRQWSSGSMLLNEVYSFQAAYYWTGPMKKKVTVNIISELDKYIKIYEVGLVPSEMPCYWDHDDNVLRSSPGLYPDVLIPVKKEGITLLPYQWRSLWVEVKPACQALPGNYPVILTFLDEDGRELGREVFGLEIVNASLPAQTLIHTEWFHSDCIATWYKVDVFSKDHWKYMEKYIRTAAEHGINMILTPLFTPPLDTEIGGERPTVQLVDVEKSGNIYTFGFERLLKWFHMCSNCGIEYFEFSHLFTQWGAKHAPKIMAMENGNMRKIFGWDTNAAGKDYADFLAQFLPELTKLINQEGLADHSYFHVSDEPSADDSESYKNASQLINQYTKGFKVIDALSSYEYYENGLIKNPVPPTNHIETFLEHGVEDLWTYYCCGQYREVSNRFFAMPSARNRIIGMQLYKFNIKGFLQWGYNFWYSQYSRFQIDPFRVTDADCAFPSGDAFVVYPGKDGPLVSLRLKVFFEALQDLRALKLLEKLEGHAAVMNILEEGLNNPITFTAYPQDAEWLLHKREQINRRIASQM